MTMAAQSLGRTVGPPIHGFLFDLDYQSSYLVLGVVALCGALASLLLLPFVPMANRAAPSSSLPAEELPDSAEQGQDESSVSFAGEREALVCRLHQRKRHYQDVLELVKAGQEDHRVPISSDDRAQAKHEMTEWLVSMIEARGYDNWPRYQDALRLMFLNTFPPLRTASREEQLSDFVRMFEAHIAMAEQTKTFAWSEGLVNVA